MNIRTDTELVKAAQNGGVDDFGELYRRHWAAAVGVAYCAVMDRHLAEDAAQEAFAVASHKLAGLRRGSRFGPWICTIAKRKAVRMARSLGERTVLPDTPAAEPTDSAPHTSDLVRQAVADLPDRSREVVVLHYFTGLSHNQIADSLGLSPSAVHGRLVRARRMLADRLRGNGMGDLEL